MPSNLKDVLNSDLMNIEERTRCKDFHFEIQNNESKLKIVTKNLINFSIYLI